MNTLALRHYKASLRMTERQRQILNGMLLGDGHLERQGGAQSARLKIAAGYGGVFMDDGSRKSSQCRGLYLNTQSFTSSEVELLRLVVRRDVGVETTVRRQSDGLQIYVPSSSVTEMVAFIQDEMLPSMRYKLPD